MGNQNCITHGVALISMSISSSHGLVMYISFHIVLSVMMLVIRTLGGASLFWNMRRHHSFQMCHSAASISTIPCPRAWWWRNVVSWSTTDGKFVAADTKSPRMTREYTHVRNRWEASSCMFCVHSVQNDWFGQFLLWRFVAVRSLSCNSSHKKNLILGGTRNFHGMDGNGITIPGFMRNK